MTRLLLRDARIWGGICDDLEPARDLLIENGVIREIGTIRSAKGAEILQMNDQFVMPGLIDAHFHAYWGLASVPELERMPLSYLAHHASGLLERALRRGFTSVRDAGGADWGLWRALQDGLIDGPRLFYSGRALSQTGGHGDSRAQHEEPCGCRFVANLSEIADGPDEVRARARETLRQGAHQLKIFLSGGVVSPTDPIWMAQYADAEISVAVEEAARWGTYVMAHAYTADAATRAARLGVRTVEHGNLIDTAAAEAMARAGTFLTPTLVTYDALTQHAEQMKLSPASKTKLEAVAEQGAEAVKIARAAGVSIGFGTDLAGPLHPLQRDEFRLRGKIEDPIHVLRSATSVNAAMMKQEGRLGVLAPGACADLIALPGDPREDLSVLFADAPAPTLIMRHGRTINAG